MTEMENPMIDRMMLIDDSEVDQMIYKRIVNKSGMVGDLVQFKNARDALAVLEDAATENPDLILLDINMPGMDGFEFLEAVTANLGSDICTVVVMLTTSLNPKDEERARSFALVHDFLNKPLTLKQLGHLSELIRKDRERRAA